MAVIVSDDGRRLTLTGDVGDMFFGMFDHFTHSQVVEALAGIDDDAELEVWLNSGGGYTDEGSAIRAELVSRPGTTNVVVTGIAASAASFIAMAGETIRMVDGSYMMIHDPSGVTSGNKADHEKSIEALEAIASSWARVYSRRSGQSVEEVRKLMADEAWFNPEQAVEAGFADEVEDEAQGETFSAFPYQTYSHAPRQLVAMARKKGWKAPSSPQAAAPSAAAPTAQQEETPMPGQTDKSADKQTADLDQIRTEAAADAIKADRERRSAIMALDEAKGRESLADHLYANTEMDVAQVKATLAASPVTANADPEPEGDDAYDRARARAAHGAGLGGEPKPTAPKGKGQSEAIKAAADKRKKRAAR